ncbi:hypothetical protein M3Y94_01093400 [Aphelenchoides besseyi]|nr:hypothetical protein M3Y94_01093400 [Aphelenchoides besseyi]
MLKQSRLHRTRIQLLKTRKRNRKKANREIETVDQLVDKLISSVFRDGLCEAVRTLKQKPKKRSHYRTIMEFGLLAIIALLAALFRYSDLVESKLAVRGPPQPRHFFHRNSNVVDYFRGDGASYAELYNQADLTVLMFYAPWSLHSMEARTQFTEVATTLKNFTNIRFVAVNCDIGLCKRTLKLYYYPVIVGLTTVNTAVIYEDSPTVELLLSWVTKLMFPLHQVISIDDPLLTTTNYDRIVLAYLPLEDNSELTREFNVYKLAAMRCKDRVLFCVTVDVGVAAHFGLHREGFKLMNRQNVTHIHRDFTATSILETINNDLVATRSDHVQWISRETDDDGGKSVKLHSLLNEHGNLVVLLTTPVYQQQTSTNLENLRLMARSYTTCDFVSSSVASYSNWADELSWQRQQSCDSNELETISCCDYIQHQKLCKSKPTGYLKLVGTSTECSLLSRVHRSGKLIEHCCHKKTLSLSSKQQMHCLFPSFYEHQSFDQKTVDLKSHGLACKTNRTVNFVVMDKRSAGYFMKIWNVNLTGKEDVDHLAIISTYDDAVFSTPIEGGIGFMDAFLTAYSNGSLIPNVFDESDRDSFFNQVPEEVDSADDHDDESCEIERLTAADFRSKILNDTNRVFSAIVFFSGGNGHGPSMAVNYILQTVKREFAAFDSLIRFFIIDVSRNSLPWAYVFDSLPSLMFFPAIPFPQTQSSLFPRELPFTIPNLMAFVLARAQPELRFRVALRACSSACLTVNRQRVHQFESAVRSNLRTLWLSKRRYTHARGSKQIDFLLRRRRLQLNAARYLQNVLRMLQTHRSDGNVRLSTKTESSIVEDSLLLRWLIANNFGQNFNSYHSFEL